MKQEIPMVVDCSTYLMNATVETLAAYGVKGMILQVSRGCDQGNIAYQHNNQVCAEAGLFRGGFHVYDPRCGWLVQAKTFLASLRSFDFPPALVLEHSYDIETEVIVYDARRWLEYVKHEIGFKPMICTRAIWFNRYIGPWCDWKGAYSLWIAHYTNADQPYIPKGWDDWDLWQYSKNGRIPGVKSSLDFNRVNPNGEFWRIYQATARTAASRDD